MKTLSPLQGFRSENISVRAVVATDRRVWREWLIAAADRVLAALLLIPAIPLAVVLMAMIRLTPKRPALNSQLRLGFGSRAFFLFRAPNDVRGRRAVAARA